MAGLAELLEPMALGISYEASGRGSCYLSTSRSPDDLGIQLQMEMLTPDFHPIEIVSANSDHVHCGKEYLEKLVDGWQKIERRRQPTTRVHATRERMYRFTSASLCLRR